MMTYKTFVVFLVRVWPEGRQLDRLGSACALCLGDLGRSAASPPAQGGPSLSAAMEAVLKQTPPHHLQMSPLEDETETGDLILR